MKTRVSPYETSARRRFQTNIRQKVQRGGNYVRELRLMWQDWKSAIQEVFLLPAPGTELLAGLTVAAVALPLNIALAVACGLPPSAGLLAGAVGGLLAAVFGGASLQVTGPAAALNFLVFGIVKDFGPAGAAGAAIIVGLISVISSFALLGRLARFVPETVLAGFMTGVGLKLLDNQIPELLGFDYTVSELAVMLHRPVWLYKVSWLAVVCGLFVALIVITTRHWKRFPAGLVGVVIVTGLSMYLNWDIERVGNVTANFTWHLPVLPLPQWGQLFLQALPLAFLAMVESLLSAQATDRMTKATKPFNPNLELFGQGVANLAAGMVMGMPATGVIVRSTVNVQSGAKSRLSAIIHCLFLFFSVFYLGSLIGKIPLAGLAGLLCVIGFRLIEASTLMHLFKEHRVGAAAFLVTAIGTVSGKFVEGLVLGLTIEAVYWLLTRRVRQKEQKAVEARSQGVRAILPKAVSARQRLADYEPQPSGVPWQNNVKQRAQIAPSAYIHPKASVIGRVVLGENVHIAAGSSVRADEGTPFYIGDNSNVQDGVVIHALKEKWVNVGGERWAVYVGKKVSMAHQALVHGPCFVGDHSFIGFRAVVHDSVLGSHCYVGIGAVVIGVEVASDRYVPHGAIIDTQEKADNLPEATEAHGHFNSDVVEVNRGLASAYRDNLAQQLGLGMDGKLDHRLELSPGSWRVARDLVY